MSSVLFQEVREFRAMAYSAGSGFRIPSFKRRPDAPGAFYSVVGTQADKAMEAIAIVDSVYRQMPSNSRRFDVARQEQVNQLDTQFPSFRQIGQRISYEDWLGYDSDPEEQNYMLLADASFNQMLDFYHDNIQNHQHQRVIGVVGNVKTLDLNALAKYGKVTILKLEDIYNK